MKLTAYILAALLILSACTGKRPGTEAPHRIVNGAYYWKTRFCPDSAERSFISRHGVERIYLRMFDVTTDDNNSVVPDASVSFSDGPYSIPDSCEFVPVVFITLDALRALAGNTGALAANIVTRVKNMCSYHSLPGIAELQLDCDWTGSTRNTFFALCDSIRSQFARQQLGWRLSSTIRLHQLKQKAPPVDCGVLMVYNTGSFDNPDEENSIISTANVGPYLDALPSYPLYLDVAYPIYSWQLLFRGRRFIGLLNGANVADTALFSTLGPNQYRARQFIKYGNHAIQPGDVIRCEGSDAPRLTAVHDMVEKKMAGRPHGNIIYHLDNSNLQKYNSDEIDNIFRAD